jgi:hypothetical protein
MSHVLRRDFHYFGRAFRGKRFRPGANLVINLIDPDERGKLLTYRIVRGRVQTLARSCIQPASSGAPEPVPSECTVDCQTEPPDPRPACEGAGRELLPREELRAIYFAVYLPVRSGIYVGRLGLRRAPAGATVELLCDAAGCPFGLRLIPVRGGTVDLARRLRGRLLRRRGKLEIRLARASFGAAVIRITIGRSGSPRFRTLCRDPNRAEPHPCRRPVTVT